MVLPSWKEQSTFNEEFLRIIPLKKNNHNIKFLWNYPTLYEEKPYTNKNPIRIKNNFNKKHSERTRESFAGRIEADTIARLFKSFPHLTAIKAALGGGF